MMFGGFHIEIAALKTLGDCLKGSGWVQALVQAEISTLGTADSFLQAAHVVCTRRAHQVRVAALHILKHQAYGQEYARDPEKVKKLLDFKDWCIQREHTSPQFQYWAIVM